MTDLVKALEEELEYLEIEYPEMAHGFFAAICFVKGLTYEEAQ